VERHLLEFASPTDDAAIEWSGHPIGRTNTVTRTKSRTRFHDKTIDAKPGRREELVNAAIEHIVLKAGKQPLYLSDAVIHGVRVRAITNSEHLYHFWLDNWYSPDEWNRATGIAAPEQPRVIVYALGGLESQREAAYYSRAANTIVFFNTSYYGQLKSWVLGAVGRILSDEFGVHSIHGACVEKDGSGVLYIAPTGTGKSTSSYGLIGRPRTRFHSDDWVYIRYVLWSKAGQAIAPMRIDTGTGESIRGYRCHRWLENRPADGFMVTALGFDNAEITLDSTEIDWSRPLEAYAYTSEKVFYLRSNLVENFPEMIGYLLDSNLENVPDVTPAFMEEHRSTIDSVLTAIRASADPSVRLVAARNSDAQLRCLIARLFAFDNARAMLDPVRCLPHDRVYSNPMEPLHITNVFLLKRNPADEAVLESLTLERFMERLLLGDTPDGKREIAYNAYRAVDDDVERVVVNELEAEAKASGQPMYGLLSTRLTDGNTPESLREEFELFRAMHRSAACYDINTILQRDPNVRSKQEAVARTIGLIEAAVAERGRLVRCTLHDYLDAIVVGMK
jgi:hypothetical protein